MATTLAREHDGGLHTLDIRLGVSRRARLIALFVVVVTACGAPVAPGRPVTPVTRVGPVETYCPDLHLGVWSSELFPACAPPPFDDWRLPLCAAGACPRPCGEVFASFDFGSLPELIAVIRYDAQGRWSGSTTAGTELVARYDHGLVEVRDGAIVETATRDATERIAKLVRDSETSVVTWGTDGVTGVGAHAIRYVGHLIAGVDDAVISRDPSGRVTGDGTRTFAYDDRGRLARRDQPGRTLEINRDATGRLEELVEHHDGGDNGHILFNYACD